jgi:hypothetical protein
LVFSLGILVSYPQIPGEPGPPNIGTAAGHACWPGPTRFHGFTVKRAV